MTPTQRSLAKLRNEGWTVCVVERWIAAIHQRKDAFGFGDLLGCKIGEPALLVQTTTGSNASSRITKIKTIAEAAIWLTAGHRIVIHAWRKVGPRGKRKLWDCAETEFRNELKDKEIWNDIAYGPA